MQIDWKQRYAYLLQFGQQLRKRWEIISLASIALLAIAVWPVPQWMVRHEYWDWASNSNEYAKRVDDYRKTLVQILGGAFLLYTLYLTLRRTKAAEEALLLTQRTLDVTRETQITEILTAYVRHNSPSKAIADDEAPEGDHELDKDIQGIMTVIGRARGLDKGRLDLTRVDLRGVKLPGANLKGAFLTEADLSGAYLNSANLSEAMLGGAKVRGAILHKTNLTGAFAGEANLKSAKLVAAIWTTRC